MKLENIDKQYAIYGMLFSISNRIQTIGDKAFEGITIKQQFLMIALGMFEQPPTLREMGALIGCSYQNVKRMATQLEKSGFLNIVGDKQDKRKLLLVSTGKFESQAEQSQEITLNFMENLYEGVTQDELETTLKTLMKMDYNIGGVIE